MFLSELLCYTTDGGVLEISNQVPGGDYYLYAPNYNELVYTTCLILPILRPMITDPKFAHHQYSIACYQLRHTLPVENVLFSREQGIHSYTVC
jgi:hypothetical protein